MSGSGRGYQPDFLSEALANLYNFGKGLGQGVQDFLGGPQNPTDAAVQGPLGGQLNRGAVHAPLIGGALEGVGTVGGVITAPLGLPSLLTGDAVVRQAALNAYRTQGGDVPSLLDVPAVARALTAAREAQAGEFAQVAENQSQPFPLRTVAAVAQFATGALPNVAPLPLIPGGRTAGGGAVDALRGLATPKGAIASRLEELTAQGLTPEQGFAAVSHEFGDAAALRFATTGDDVFVAPRQSITPPVPEKAPIGGLTPEPRRVGENPEVVPGGVTYERPQFAGAPTTEFLPTAVSPKMGHGTPRENLGVNLDKIDAPQETKDYIESVAQKNAGFEEQRRGVVTTAETQAAADKIAVDAEKYAYLRPGTALNAEQIKAVRDALVAKGNEVTSLQEAVRAQEAAGVVSKETTLRLLAAGAEHQTLQRVFAGVRAESGRALRIQREISDGLRRGDINGTYDRAVELLGGKVNADLMLKRLQDIWTDPKLSADAREIATYRFLQNMDRATTADMIQEFWTNAILSSPVTHAVNVTGQTLLHIADLGTNFLTAAVDALTAGGARLVGKTYSRERTFSGAFGAIASTGNGFRRGIANLRDSAKIDATKFRETGRLQAGNAIGSGYNASRAERAVGAVVNVPTKLLGAEDAVFRGLGEARGIYEAAYDTAAREGLRPFSGKFAERVSELIQNPTDEMVAHAKDVAQRAALRQEPGAASKLLIRLRDTLTVPGTDFKPLRYAIPFVTTPLNILKIGAEYSPLGFVQAIRHTGGARSESIARAALGSAAMAYFVQQYALGNVTGPAPTDPAEKDAFYASGKIPYAAKIGNEWVSFARLEPIATPLRWTVAMMQAGQQEGSKGSSVDVVAAKMAFALAAQMKDATYLEGLSNLVDAFDDPRKAAQFLTGFNPALVRTLVQANDPYIRDPKNVFEQIEATLPFLNQNVAPKQTAYGEPAMRTEGKQGIAGVISPVDFSQEQGDQVTAKVMSYKLPESIGPNGQPLPARALNVGFVSQDIASFHLAADEGSRYQTLAGQATKNMLEKLFADQLTYEASGTGEPTVFSKLLYEDQVRAIRKTITDAREVGRAQAADEFMSAATNDGQIARAAIMRLSTIGKLRDQARYLDGLRRQGELSSAVVRSIDAARGKDDPTVAEFVQAAPVIDEFVSEPPYRIGNDETWAQVRIDRKKANTYAAATGKPAGIPVWRWYARVDGQAATRIRLYDREQVRNPKRAALLRRYPWLERFVSDA